MRLFVALRPPPATRSLLADVQADVARARWQSDEQLHLTLRFVGDVERPQAEDLAAALAGVYAPSPVIALAGVGRFIGRGGDTLWAGVGPHAPLDHLHRKVEHACARAGLAPEGRAYLPHITLARLPRSARGDPAIDRWLASYAGLASEPFALDHLILYASILASDGAAYEPLIRWPLARSG